ncbi:MAG: ABC transporter ATP-binding protein [Gammaproteobacteria bacterium]|nr:ABC transporter ATP-binding protein [Gammaproteobacteria bacterium]
MIQLKGIHRTFQVGDQEVHALNEINLNVSPGEYLSIMGPSGSGKSTLLNLLGLLDRPTSGTYLLNNQDVTVLSDFEQAKTRRNKIGFVFQFFQLLPRLTAQENVELPMMLDGIAPNERSQRATEVLDAMGLSDRRHHRPDQLSGGQRQRVAIARATIMEPAILLADEPTGNLDSKSGLDVIKILEQLNNKGLTLIIVTHDPEIGVRAKRHIHMIDGKIVESRTDTIAETKDSLPS